LKDFWLLNKRQLDNKKLTKIGGVSVYIENLVQYATESYYLYSSIINNHLSYVNSLNNVSPQRQSRKRAIDAIRDSTINNLNSLYEVQNLLKGFISPELLTVFRPNPNDDLAGYLKDLKYLKRDWGWSDSAEEQIKILTDNLNNGLDGSFDGNGDAVFLGAGLGRFAFNLAHLFSKVYAIDKSFSMAYHFNKLIKEDIEFFEILPKNVYSSSDSVGKIRTTIYPPHLEKKNVNQRIDKIEYIVSDVQKLPFDSVSVSAVFSIYFTDVIALKLWLPEVNRILKVDGFFIHLGPLDYFFSDISEMLSAEEVRTVFEENGFETKVDRLIETTHLHSEKHFSNKIYQNWLFIAQKKGLPIQTSITNASIVRLADNANYLIKGNLNKGVEKRIFELVLPNGEIFEGAEAAIDIIKLVLTKEKSVNELLNDLQLIYGKLDESTISYLMTIIKILIDKRVLSHNAD
jgi:carnosine N-methyltransferase